MGVEFQNKVVLVTGAASGIGRVTALAFAKQAAKVVISDVNHQGLEETLRMIEKEQGEGLIISCNISQASEVKTMIEGIYQKFGRLDCAYNNAGTEGTPSAFTECTEENWDRTMNINLKGTWNCLRFEIPKMIEQGGGTIVNCSSIAGLVGFESIPAYVASKHGVIGLTKAAAIEYAKQGIRVNAVCPGPIHTPMLERFTQGEEGSMAQAVPMGRVGTPEEIADAVLWLCSNKSSYVSGQALAIDGGWVSQ